MERNLSVSQVNHYISTLLETNSVLKRMTVTGEISNFKRQGSGHLYFYLKDAGSRISCVLFKGNTRGLTFLPEDGMKVVVRGNISVYEPSGQYQLMVRTMEPDGQGDLFQQFEALKERLAKKGWFDPEKKAGLPEVIKRVGVVTSPSGAAIHDIISVITRRDPGVEILLCPTVVQGDGAALSIASAIDQLCDLGDIDVIIVGRGGGSMEDLWAFNEEPVAEAIHFADIPIISAVGHETDFTIADFVADFRAPTPSVAGEMVAQDIRERYQVLAAYRLRLTEAMMGSLKRHRQWMEALSYRIAAKNPGSVLEKERLNLAYLESRLISGIHSVLQEEHLLFSGFRERMGVLDIRATLERGFVIVRDTKGQLVRTPGNLEPGSRLKLTFAGGDLTVIVSED
ncbi:exodeoxyribonuclease VII large subunit [Eubacterium barkeri]|uniref:Exodeoxyribonuclease 7 large subunit n=1 Tax=Eubacterium barkeri TaxID=1528 RepID=A0A1H3E7B6_EUBBA|nr:exodeoxyribonuclease VII large subunit [Eubacterium barkeri]SDX73824.1 Exodeoxyribonuclease VII large subunit [Eubacterium barkeri]